MTDGVVEVDIFLAHPPEQVWRLLSDAKLLAEWLMPTTGFAPIVGTRFQLVGSPVPRTGFTGVIECEVLEVDPPTQLAISWSGIGTDVDSTVRWRLVAEGRGTRVFLTHAGFDLDDPGQALAFRIMGGGWRSHVARRMEQVLLRRRDA